MKRTIFIVCIVLIACSSTKKNNENPVLENSARNLTDSLKLPVCLRLMIDQFKGEEKQNPPRSIYQYSYNGKTVYYVTPPCCDFFSDLYDSSCVLIGHPDGGFTGKGDGKLSDFNNKRTNEMLVWKDDRK